jgi:hypothetical protein
MRKERIMKPRFVWTLMLVTLFALAGCSIAPSPPPTPEITPVATTTSSPTATPVDDPTATLETTPIPVEPTSPPVEPTSPAAEPTRPPGDPFELISQESLFAFMEDLTAIQPYSGWRNSATEGESEALSYVAEVLEDLPFLQGLGLALEHQSFRVFLATELWETRVHLTIDGQASEVPADGLRGPRDDIAQALRFDSDGVLNDSDPNPVVVAGPAVLVRSAEDIRTLSQADLQGKVVLLDYGVIDRALLGSSQATEIASDLMAKGPAGLILVTSFSNRPHESHGSFVGDLSALTGVETEPAPPVLYVRLEDMAALGIEDWQDLAQVEAARLTWDADVFSPGDSGNLVAHIPGTDGAQAVILGAHIDSPNGPGAMDDGSGSVVLLEVARVLNAARFQPPTDLYLVWFGSEEIGLYGSYHFVSTHQELLDRSLAMLQMDMLCHPLEGIDAYLNIITWSYGRLGDDRLTWPDYVSQAAERQGISTYPSSHYGIESDNSAFAGFDVPNANLIYMNDPEMASLGGVHYGCHIHDPYDTVDLAREEGDVLEQMARVVLSAALETGREAPELHVAPRPDRRVLFVASHTESVHMAPTTFTDLGMAFAWEGFDVDMIPYERAVTASDLEDADLVVVLPVLDYPSPEGDPAVYDETWSQREIETLKTYVDGGGMLVLTNSANRLKYNNQVLDSNEDWGDVNALAEHFGIAYRDGGLKATEAWTERASSLLGGTSSLALARNNGVSFTMRETANAQVLAWAGGEPAMALIDSGDAGGQVLILADVGMLATDGGEPANLDFWLNLAEYARAR